MKNKLYLCKSYFSDKRKGNDSERLIIFIRFKM